MYTGREREVPSSKGVAKLRSRRTVGRGEGAVRDHFLVLSLQPPTTCETNSLAVVEKDGDGGNIGRGGSHELP